MDMNYEFCDGITHTIKKGDTLYEISRMHNVPLAMLLRANPYVDVFNLRPGDTICVPASRTTQQGDAASEEQAENAGQGIQQEEDGRETESESSSVSCRSAEQKNASCDGKWEKYVVKPGDTLADVMQEMSGDIIAFLEKNGQEHVYLLPGAAYYICR